jgi:hypothetical protein
MIENSYSLRIVCTLARVSSVEMKEKYYYIYEDLRNCLIYYLLIDKMMLKLTFPVPSELGFSSLVKLKTITLISLKIDSCPL